MLSSILLVLCLLRSLLAADVASNDVSVEIREEMTNAMIAQTERAFMSEDFAPVGSAREKALSATSFSPTGSVYQTVYANSDGTPDTICANELSVNGYAVNYCIVATNFAFKFQLVQSSCSGGVVQYFSDKACTNYLGASSLSGTPTCSYSQDYQHYLGSNAYQNIRCITTAKPVLPTSNYVAQEDFDNTKCSGNPFSYLAFVVGKCFLYKGKPAAYLCNNGIPTLNYYSNSGCMGTLTSTISYPTSCNLGDVNIGDDDWEYIPPIIHPPPTTSTTHYPTSNTVTTSSMVFCQAHAPTMKPAGYPTYFPTASLGEPVSFTVTQVIDGIDAATYSSSTLNAYALTATIGSVMSGVPSSAVINLQVSNTSPTRRRRLGEVTDAAPQAMAGKAIAATYTITTTTVYSQNQLYSELSNSVVSGSFNTLLTVNANNVGATNMAGCTSKKINYYGEGGDGGSGGSVSLSVAAIVGIVVGVLGGITLITALVVFIVVQRRRAKTPLSAQGTYQPNSGPPNSPPAHSPAHPSMHPHTHSMPVTAPSPYAPPAPPASAETPLPVARPVNNA